MQVAVQVGYLNIQAAFPLTVIGIFNNFYIVRGALSSSPVWISNKPVLLFWFARAFAGK